MNRNDTLVPQVFADGFDPARVDRSRYFLSLLDEGRAAGLFSEALFSLRMNELMERLAEQIGLWTNGRSSSVMQETAEALLNNLLYLLDLALSAAPEPRAAAAMLARTPVFPLYEAGMLAARRHLDRCRVYELALKKFEAMVLLPPGPAHFLHGGLRLWLDERDLRFNACEELYVPSSVFGRSRRLRGVAEAEAALAELCERMRSNAAGPV